MSMLITQMKLREMRSEKSRLLLYQEKWRLERREIRGKCVKSDSFTVLPKKTKKLLDPRSLEDERNKGEDVNPLDWGLERNWNSSVTINTWWVSVENMSEPRACAGASGPIAIPAEVNYSRSFPGREVGNNSYRSGTSHIIYLIILSIIL